MLPTGCTSGQVLIARLIMDFAAELAYAIMTFVIRACDKVVPESISGGFLHVCREESAQLQAENEQRSNAMQARLDALQALKDEVSEAERFMAQMDQRV